MSTSDERKGAAKWGRNSVQLRPWSYGTALLISSACAGKIKSILIIQYEYNIFAMMMMIDDDDDDDDDVFLST